MSDKLLDFDRDIEILAQKIDWIDDDEAKKNFVINFCSSKAKS